MTLFIISGSLKKPILFWIIYKYNPTGNIFLKMHMKLSSAENWIWIRIRELRNQKGISQEVLAVKAGIPMVSLAKVEQWQIKKPGFPMVWKISIALGVTLNELVEGLDPKKLLFNDKE